MDLGFNRNGYMIPRDPCSSQENHSLSPEQLQFERQFANWDRDFTEWKVKNAIYSNTQGYLLYEQKMMELRDRLIERRAELKLKYQNVNRHKTFDKDLGQAAAAAQSILSQFGGEPSSSSYRSYRYDARPQYQGPMRNNKSFINYKIQKRQTNNPLQPLEPRIERYRKILEEGKKAEGIPKGYSGHIHLLHRKLRENKPDKTTWTEEEKVLNEFVELCWIRRRDVLYARKLAFEAERKKNESSENAETEAEKIEDKYDPENPIEVEVEEENIKIKEEEKKAIEDVKGHLENEDKMETSELETSKIEENVQ